MDRLLRDCGAALRGDRVMDSIALERERGITIASKYTSMSFEGTTLNVVDTPGHADFGGEVERVLGMVDGAVLLVDAGEGPLAQTKFVLAKALRRGLRPLVLLNKIDRPTLTQGQVQMVESAVFDLFANLGANDEQLDFPVLYASAREGWASQELPPVGPLGLEEQQRAACKSQGKSMRPLLQAIVDHVPAPIVDLDAPFRLLVSMVQRDAYLGRLLTGRIASGSVHVGDRVTRISKPQGLAVIELQVAHAGDIVAIAGLGQASVTHTISHLELLEPLPTALIDPPTISMTFGVNDSPLAGRDGDLLTGTKIGEYLTSEAESNLSLVVHPTAAQDAFQVQGRGELQLGILIENMRRQGFELSVSPPVVLFQQQGGVKLEPVEEVVMEMENRFAGAVVDALTQRKGSLLEMQDAGSGRTRLHFHCPSRGLLGYRATFNTQTHGSGIMHRSFHAYEEWRGPLDGVRKGVLVSMANGTITAYALAMLEARGHLFVEPGMEAYDGMVIGECSRHEDIEVNPVKAKYLTNVRAAGKDDNVRLSPPRQMSLEEAIGYIAADELIEVTPRHIRIRKKALSASQRKVLRRTAST
eukprot:SM000002S05745  [mRNA]  locus=s2:1926824:1930958:- [translate_table: standard]